jgi:hypothetical protein
MTGRRDFNQAAIAPPETMKCSGISVAEHGVCTNRSHRRQPTAVLVDPANGVHATAEAPKTQVRDPSRHR